MVIEMYGVVGAGIASGSGGEHTIGTVGTGSLSDRVAVLKTRTWEMMNKAAVKAVSYFVVIIATRQSIILAKLRYLYYGYGLQFGCWRIHAHAVLFLFLNRVDI